MYILVLVVYIFIIHDKSVTVKWDFNFRLKDNQFNWFSDIFSVIQDVFPETNSRWNLSLRWSAITLSKYSIQFLKMSPYKKKITFMPKLKDKTNEIFKN